MPVWIHVEKDPIGPTPAAPNRWSRGQAFDIAAEGFCCISTNAARSNRRLLAGAFASCFSARSAMWMVQVMEDFLERLVLAPADFGSTFADC
jgi:hypothetical protein